LSFLDRLAQTLAGAIAGTGAYAPFILLFASFVEYVFPPFPGDVLVLLGASYAVQGILSWPVTFLAVTAGALAGAFVDYRIGAYLGARLDARAARKGALTAERLARFEVSYRRYGTLLLLGNRFLPGIRAFVFLAAGAARIPLWKALLFGGISTAAWNALLLSIGGLIAHNFAELSQLLSRYTSVALVVMSIAAGLLLLRWALRRRRTGSGDRVDSP
jgi:membrane protein DedA with SNARE-associated domain